MIRKSKSGIILASEPDLPWSVSMAPPFREMQMNDAWGYDDNEQTEPGHNDGPKALRDAYAAQKKANEEIMAELAAIRQERATEKLSSVFSELGVPDAAKLYTGEPDPEKARAWAESMRAAFGSGNAQGATTPAAVPTPPALDGQTQQQYQQMTQAGVDGNAVTSFEAASAGVASAQNLQELMAAMNAAQHLQ